MERFDRLDRILPILISRIPKQLFDLVELFNFFRGFFFEAALAIAQFIDALMHSPFFTDASLVNAVQDAGGNSRFELRCLTRGVS